MTLDLSPLAVIGTAGRREDQSQWGHILNYDLYDLMYKELIITMDEWKCRTLISGGAAWADHLAVRAFLEGEALELKLMLPAPFNGQYRPQGDGKTANQYHHDFSSRCDIDSLSEIKKALEKGATFSIGQGFKDRNIDVALAARSMLAMTFGPAAAIQDFSKDNPGFMSSSNAGLKSGGTAHTWREAYRCERKRHVPLQWLAYNANLGHKLSS